MLVHVIMKSRRKKSSSEDPYMCAAQPVSRPDSSNSNLSDVRQLLSSAKSWFPERISFYTRLDESLEQPFDILISAKTNSIYFVGKRNSRAFFDFVRRALLTMSLNIQKSMDKHLPRYAFQATVRFDDEDGEIKRSDTYYVDAQLTSDGQLRARLDQLSESNFTIKLYAESIIRITLGITVNYVPERVTCYRAEDTRDISLSSAFSPETVLGTLQTEGENRALALGSDVWLEPQRFLVPDYARLRYSLKKQERFTIHSIEFAYAQDVLDREFGLLSDVF